jgi:2C-methyl-D-erythritol 2,4-cyclodiphosphate synthase
MDNSDINISNFSTERINLNMDNSNIWLNQENKSLFSIHFLDILAKNHSSINSNKFKIGNIDINLQNSDANLQGISNKINGTLSDSSSVSIALVGEISLKTDSTSKVNVNN